MSEVGPTVCRMIIDCGECAVRGNACADCVVTFLTVPVRPAEPAVAGGATVGGATAAGTTAGGATASADAGPASRVELDAAEQGAIGVLARSGLVPPLRLRRVV